MFRLVCFAGNYSLKASADVTSCLIILNKALVIVASLFVVCAFISNRLFSNYQIEYCYLALI